MAADRPYGEFYDFYSVSPGYFGYYLIGLCSGHGVEALCAQGVQNFKNAAEVNIVISLPKFELGLQSTDVQVRRGVPYNTIQEFLSRTRNGVNESSHDLWP
jgi:hypothetical protein